MVYINECIDSETEFGKKYLSLVSKDDELMATHLHHIVPVAYFKDVLGISECRKKGSPDMDPDNLVKLSVGKHLLAHYYLMKCAKKCIKAQMVNAFMCTYKTTSVDGITEEDVLARMAELDAEYAALKNGKRPHKDEITISNGKNTHRLTRWLNGEKYGTYVVYDNNGRIKELGKYGTHIKIRLFYIDEYPYNLPVSKYAQNELVHILVDVGMLGGNFTGMSFWSDNLFSLDESNVRGGYRAIFKSNADDSRVKRGYVFQKSRYQLNNKFYYDIDTATINSELLKCKFHDETYEIVASIMGMIRTCKEVCPHMYKNLCKDIVLNKVASKAKTKHKDVEEMLLSVKEYVSSKVIPCELLPLVA